MSKKNITKIKIFSIIYIVLGILCSAYFFVLISLEKVGFDKIWILLGLIFIILGTFQYLYYKELCINPKKVYKPWVRKFKLTLKVIIIVGFTIFLSLFSIIAYNGEKADKEKGDYLVVLGAGLKGKTMSQALQQRMEKALEYINHNPNIKVVVSGGQGPNEDISEAQAMEDFLVNKGIKKEQIIKEDKSRNTYENFKFVKEKIKELDNKENVKINIVTNNFHVFRAKMLARRNGFTAYGVPAPLHPLIRLNCYTRETFALIKSYMFDK